MTRRLFFIAARSRMSGLTLLEMLVTLAIVGIILRWASVAYADYVEDARVYEAATAIIGFSATIELFIGSTGRAPNDLAEVGIGDVLDPWGFTYRYNPNMNQNGNGKVRKDRMLNPINTDFDIYSVGPDGQTNQSLSPPQSQDDVIRASNGGYIGLAEDF